MTHRLLASWLIVAGFVLCGASQASSVVFDYSTATAGVTATPFSQTVDGVTAAFTSDQDPGAFEVDASPFATFSGLMVDSPGPAFATGAKLGVVFSVPLVGVSFSFATVGAGPLQLDIYTGDFNGGGGPVSTVTISGVVPSFPFTFPEGVMSFSGAPFTSIVIQDPSDPFFAIGAITATLPAELDEPASGAMMCIALAGLLLWRIGVSRVARR
jgi:hypothetical protein